MLTHEELKTKILANPKARAEYERIEREEFALLDTMLKARHEAGLTQAQIAERMGYARPRCGKAGIRTCLRQTLAIAHHIKKICGNLGKKAGNSFCASMKLIMRLVQQPNWCRH